MAISLSCGMDERVSLCNKYVFFNAVVRIPAKQSLSSNIENLRKYLTALEDYHAFSTNLTISQYQRCKLYKKAVQVVSYIGWAIDCIQ